MTEREALKIVGEASGGVRQYRSIPKASTHARSAIQILRNAVRNEKRIRRENMKLATQQVDIQPSHSFL